MMYRIGSKGAPESAEPEPAGLPIKHEVPAYHQSNHYAVAETSTGHMVMIGTQDGTVTLLESEANHACSMS